MRRVWWEECWGRGRREGGGEGDRDVGAFVVQRQLLYDVLSNVPRGTSPQPSLSPWGETPPTRVIIFATVGDGSGDTDPWTLSFGEVTVERRINLVGIVRAESTRDASRRRRRRRIPIDAIARRGRLDLYHLFLLHLLVLFLYDLCCVLILRLQLVDLLPQLIGVPLHTVADFVGIDENKVREGGSGSLPHSFFHLLHHLPPLYRLLHFVDLSAEAVHIRVVPHPVAVSSHTIEDGEEKRVPRLVLPPSIVEPMIHTLLDAIQPFEDVKGFLRRLQSSLQRDAFSAWFVAFDGELLLSLSKLAYLTSQVIALTAVVLLVGGGGRGGGKRGRGEGWRSDLLL